MRLACPDDSPWTEPASQAAISLENARLYEGLQHSLHTQVELTLGTMGRTQRLRCGVIGDPVHLSTRMESLTKHYGVPLLVIDDTMRLLPSDQGFSYREADSPIPCCRSRAHKPGSSRGFPTAAGTACGFSSRRRNLRSIQRVRASLAWSRSSGSASFRYRQIPIDSALGPQKDHGPVHLHDPPTLRSLRCTDVQLLCSGAVDRR